MLYIEPKNHKPRIMVILLGTIITLIIITVYNRIYNKKYNIPVAGQDIEQIAVLKPGINTNKNIDKYIYEKRDFYLSGNIGPIYNSVDINYINPDRLSVYEVKSGDTVDGVAKLYDITPFTIMWANDLKSKILKPGELLLILPVSGIQHTIKKGDTIKSVAKKYNADSYEIAEFNNLNNDTDLKIGEDIIIPNGEIVEVKTKDNKITKTNINKKSTTKYTNGMTPLVRKYNNNIYNYFIRPATGIKTQGLHGRNAIDIGTPVGTPVVASAGGTVLLARSSGYNGGYGVYIIISHPNGTQTLYGHLSRIAVQNGQRVQQGQVIGYSGNSGRSTGPHLHFEVIGAVNPF